MARKGGETVRVMMQLVGFDADGQVTLRHAGEMAHGALAFRPRRGEDGVVEAILFGHKHDTAADLVRLCDTARHRGLKPLMDEGAEVLYEHGAPGLSQWQAEGVQGEHEDAAEALWRGGRAGGGGLTPEDVEGMMAQVRALSDLFDRLSREEPGAPPAAEGGQEAGQAPN